MGVAGGEAGGQAYLGGLPYRRGEDNRLIYTTMSKQPIAWHEICLTNMKVYHGRLQQEVRNAKTAADRLSREIFHRERQIAEAKRRGKDGFDADRFLAEMKPQTGGEDKG